MDLNALMKEIEARGTKWTEALEIIKAETDGKTVQEAMAEGWTVEDFRKVLLPKEPEAEAPEGSGQSSEKQAQPETHSPPSHMEAPASLNTYYISPGGFRWQFTLRPGLGAREMTALLAQAAKAETWLLKKGYKPYVPFRGNGGNTNVHGQQTNGAAPLCPTHGKPMLPSKKGEGYYCPVKIADDDGTGKPVYCKQRVK